MSRAKTDMAVFMCMSYVLLTSLLFMLRVTDEYGICICYVL